MECIICIFEIINLPPIRHKESARIVNQAISGLGLGKKGLADKLNKDPSLISRYASGSIRPKAETLLKCMQFIKGSEDEALSQSGVEGDFRALESVKKVISSLSPEMDKDVIQTIVKVLQLAKKI